MSNAKATFHEPVAPTTRYQQEIKQGAANPLSYGAESRAGEWQVERDGTSNLADQKEKGDEAGVKDQIAREANDEDYKPSNSS